MYTWSFEPSILAGIGIVTAAYMTWVAVPRRATYWQAACFIAGMALLFLALQSPLDSIGDRYLFSMHMLQHLLLVLAVPPLLVYGTPGWVLQPLVDTPVLGSMLKFICRGPIAFAIYNVVFALAHLPVWFDLTLRNNGVHILEHLLFIAAGIIAWMPILSNVPGLPRIGYPFQMLYLFLETLPCSLVGALITLSGIVLYSPYGSAPRMWNIAPIADQQIGGLEMWIGGSVFYFLSFMIVFFVWAQHDEPERRPFYVIKGTSG